MANASELFELSNALLTTPSETNTTTPPNSNHPNHHPVQASGHTYYVSTITGQPTGQIPDFAKCKTEHSPLLSASDVAQAQAAHVAVESKQQVGDRVSQR